MNSFASCYGFPFDRLRSAFALYATFGALTILAPALVSQIIAAIVGFTVAFFLAATATASGISTDAVPLIAKITGALLGSLAYIPTLPFYPAFFRCLDTEAQGSTATIDQLFAWRGLVGPSIATGFLIWAVVMVGFLFCIVPGILMIPLSAMPYYYVARGDSGMTAISKFFSALASQPMVILYSWGMFVPLVLLGYMCCCVGILVTLPMFFAGTYFMMRGLPVPR